MDGPRVPQDKAAPRAIESLQLADYVGYRLRLAQIAVFEEFIKSFATLDLRPAQFSALLIIAQNPGRNQSEVAASLGIQRANFVSFIEKLEARGLIDRRAIDRRSYALHLTREGEALLTRAVELQDALEARIEARLGEGGKARLLDLLRRLG
jgi:DNA-binding MarR family transcriptional regulator